MRGAKQPSFCGAVARASLIGVKFGGFDEGLIGSRSKMGKLQKWADIAYVMWNMIQWRGRS